MSAIFVAAPGVHGELHGGWIGKPTPEDQLPPTMLPLDEAVKLGALKPVALPASIDFSTESPGWDAKMETDDQAKEGSCVSFGWKHYVQRQSLKAGHALQEHAPRWLYRMMQLKYEPGELGNDTGAYVGWGAGVLVESGFALEEDYPYNDDPATLKEVPSWLATFRATYYRNRVPVSVPSDVTAWKTVLASDQGIVFGALLYQSFYDAAGLGNWPIPKIGTERMLGGHSMYIFGYADDNAYQGGGYFRVLNSWAGFTARNMLKMPYAMLALADSANGAVVSDNWAGALAPAA